MTLAFIIAVMVLGAGIMIMPLWLIVRDWRSRRDPGHDQGRE